MSGVFRSLLTMKPKRGQCRGNLRLRRGGDATNFFPGTRYTGSIPIGGGGDLRIYLDLVVILNFLVDFLLLLGTNRLSGFPLLPGRTAAAAALGAIYSGACMMPRLRFLGGLLWRIVCLAGVAVIAFGWGKSAWKRCGVFVLLSMALGGVAVSVGKGNFLSLGLAAVGVWLLCGVAFGDQVGGREYVPMALTHNGKTVSIVALRDSGNTLRDPVTGEQVLVISGDVAQRLTGLTQAQLRAPLDTLMRRPVPGLRLIPYRTVGQAGSMLLAMRFDKVKIGSKEGSAIVAFAPEGLGRKEQYQALTGGII